MRKIKFRGVFKTTGDFVYGDLVHDNDGNPYIFAWAETEDDEPVYFAVEPDSVAQCCGLDDNGEDCYEGDFLTLITNDNGDCRELHLGAPLKLDSALARAANQNRPCKSGGYKLVLDKERSDHND